MRLWGQRYNRDLQRYNLALRMIAHEARTHTICEWTGLPDERIRKLHASYFVGQGDAKAARRRGPSPQRLGFFLQSGRNRSEAAAFVGLCYLLRVLPAETLSNARRELPSLARGERLCHAYEMYRSLVPDSSISLEHAVLLIMTVAQGHEFQVGNCRVCGGVVVAFRHTLVRWSCAHCNAFGASAIGKPSRVIAPAVAAEFVQSDER